MWDIEELIHSVGIMESTEAWKELERHITGRITFLKDQLEHCELDKVETHRSQIRAFKNVLGKVEEMKNPIVE